MTAITSATAITTESTRENTRENTSATVITTESTGENTSAIAITMRAKVTTSATATRNRLHDENSRCHT